MGKPVLPVISEGLYGFQHVNVSHQRHDPNSLLNWMERVIRMRKEVPEIGWGEFVVLKTNSREVLAIRYDWRNNSVLVVHNFGASPCEVRLEVGVDNSECLVNLLSSENSTAESNGKHCIFLESYGYRWYRVGGLAYLLDRSTS
jgi:maltose alpha-D-glucosyltransferase/alpha-amylase